MEKKFNHKIRSLTTDKMLFIPWDYNQHCKKSNFYPFPKILSDTKPEIKFFVFIFHFAVIGVTAMTRFIDLLYKMGHDKKRTQNKTGNDKFYLCKFMLGVTFHLFLP